ncbi:MAG: DUF1192 family protein [Alphaproteobacteria bacterium]|nr:MAG: DUF1192 family protein [Alphaproteobacteria bacterium]
MEITAMDLEDEKPRRAGPLDEVEREDLESFSREDLKDRIARLEKEIARAKSALAAKGTLQSEAESLFRR